MESDKPLSIRLPKFRGAAETWFRWRDAMEAIFGAYKLMSAIDTPRPFSSPYTTPRRSGTRPSEPVVDQAGSTAGGGGADGNDAGGGVAVTGGEQATTRATRIYTIRGRTRRTAHSTGAVGREKQQDLHVSSALLGGTSPGHCVPIQKL